MTGYTVNEGWKRLYWDALSFSLSLSHSLSLSLSLSHTHTHTLTHTLSLSISSLSLSLSHTLSLYVNARKDLGAGMYGQRGLEQALLACAPRRPPLHLSGEAASYGRWEPGHPSF